MERDLYHETYEKFDGWYWKIYHYDNTGNKEIILHKSTKSFHYREDAENDCYQFQEDNDIDAELA